mmetsp:Transcript_16412/g.38604  ORF Transcript_16412/g.38604 Transcript_16412/m.38604 type:complete len:960 (-) Transcript_16412:258-3137(-)|eukprot:CAMPEP_0114559960 /NCGR_PEP_ID=MMETSP0114-20121206/11199_1 /TAXON_ID=31324 /ORGANISM="Goniomonas sp, Strain m" /LENGTH=959 /DNA_ID=CAMNT_0001745463 /DNA_START=54 /DNA_END=2933 /DNA_ORIENTATION=-
MGNVQVKDVKNLASGDLHSFNTRRERKLFDLLDKDKNGKVTLDDLLRLKEQPLLAQELQKLNIPHFQLKKKDVTRSLLTLYHFDRTRDCEMDFNEFLNLINYLRALDEQEKEAPLSLKDRAKKMLSPSAKEGGGSPSSPKPSPKGPKPVDTLLRRYYSTEDGVNSENLQVPMFSSRAATADQPQLSATDQKTRATLLATLRTRKGRRRFMNWLFRLADTDHTNCVSPAELCMFLKAIAADGINPECVCVDDATISTVDSRSSPLGPIEGIPPPETEEDLIFHQVVHRVMRSFDISQDGNLSQAEFMVLADLIEREYEMSDEVYTGGDTIGDFHLLRTLGKGSEGTVKSAVNSRTDKMVAIKIVRRGNVASMSRIDREIGAMMRLRHPNVVQVTQVLETELHIYLVMELCTGGSLEVRINPKAPLPEAVARYYFYQLMNGLTYCHKSGVCHRDLRVENLLLDSKGQLKITDFGHAGTFQPGWDYFQTMFVGSMSHLSPEQITGTCYSGEKIDVWSAGVILYHLLLGRNPFVGASVEELFDNIRNARFNRNSAFRKLSAHAQNLMELMLQEDQVKRPTSEECLSHPFLTSGKCEQLVMVHCDAHVYPHSPGAIAAEREAADLTPADLKSDVVVEELVATLKLQRIESRIAPPTEDYPAPCKVIQCCSRFTDVEKDIAFLLYLTPPNSMLDRHSSSPGCGTCPRYRPEPVAIDDDDEEDEELLEEEDEIDLVGEFASPLASPLPKKSAATGILSPGILSPRVADASPEPPAVAALGAPDRDLKRMSSAGRKRSLDRKKSLDDKKGELGRGKDKDKDKDKDASASSGRVSPMAQAAATAVANIAALAASDVVVEVPMKVEEPESPEGEASPQVDAWVLSGNLLRGDAWLFNRVFMSLVQHKYSCAFCELKVSRYSRSPTKGTVPGRQRTKSSPRSSGRTLSSGSAGVGAPKPPPKVISRAPTV